MIKNYNDLYGLVVVVVAIAVSGTARDTILILLDARGGTDDVEIVIGVMNVPEASAETVPVDRTGVGVLVVTGVLLVETNCNAEVGADTDD